MRGNAKVHGRDIPVEVQVMQTGQSRYDFNDTFEAAMEYRPDRIAEISPDQSYTYISAAQARFLSRLPYKQAGISSLTQWLVFTDLISIAGPEVVDEQCYASQYQLFFAIEI